MKTHAWILALMVVLTLIVAGCGQKMMSTNAAEKAFTSADPTLKAEWDKAMSAYKTNDYGQAIITLRMMRSQANLNPQQFNAVEDMRTTINSKMIEAANKGDTNAQRSMEELQQFRGR
jgi:hypothetical protein